MLYSDLAAVVWNRGWGDCMDFLLEISLDMSVLLLLRELLGITAAFACVCH